MNGRILASSIHRYSCTKICGLSPISSNYNALSLSVLKYPPLNMLLLHMNNPFNDLQIRHAGHSKWANIKHTKGIKDLEKSYLSTKFVNLIKIAIKDGGSYDPKINSKLADAVEQARAAKVPNETLQRILTAKEIQNGVFAIKSGSGAIIIVEVESDSIKRTRQEVSGMVRKKNLAVTDMTNVSYAFKHIGVIRCSGHNGVPANEEHLDEAINHALEAGADDVQLLESDESDGHGKVYEFVTPPDPPKLYSIRDSLTKLNYNVIYSELEYIPSSPVTLDDAQMEIISNICQKLIANNEVVRLHDNIA